MKKFLIIINLILVMLVTGVFWGTWFTLTRSIHVFPAESFILIGKTIIANVAWPMRFLMPASLLFLILISVKSVKHTPSFIFYATSFILMLVTLLITVLVEVPIDNEVKTWTAGTLPDNWTVIRARWSMFHTIRTFTAILSFIALSVGVLLTPHPADSRFKI